MASYNRVVLLGNVTRLPDVRNLPGSATTVANTGLAVSRRYKDKEEVMFIDIVVYGKLAETMGMYVQKGTSLLVEGRLSFRQWEQDGQKRSKHEVIVDSFQMIGSRRNDNANFDENMTGRDSFRTSADDSMVDRDELKIPADSEMVSDEDIPF